jgi:sugar lactone lactonase YvrE
MSTLEIIANDNNLCGEGPIWDTAHQRLYWNDMNASLVFQYDHQTSEHKTISTGLMAAGMTLNTDGSLLFAGFSGLHLWRAQADFKTLVTHHDGEELFFNDILADEHGRLYAGTIYWGADGSMTKTGKLYRIDPDLSVHIMDGGFGMANGLGLSLDGKTLYFADSTARRIYAYQVDPATGNLSNRRDFVRVPVDEGMPDGVTIDADGFIWNAQWYGGQVVRYDPDGKVERRIQLPVTQIASLIFGGPDLNELYITTAGDNWPSPFMPTGYDPNKVACGGVLYRTKLDIQGRLDFKTRFQA